MHVVVSNTDVNCFINMDLNVASTFVDRDSFVVVVVVETKKEQLYFYISIFGSLVRLSVMFELVHDYL